MNIEQLRPKGKNGKVSAALGEPERKVGALKVDAQAPAAAEPDQAVEQALDEFVEQANSSFSEDYDGWDIASDLDKFVEQSRTQPVAPESQPAPLPPPPRAVEPPAAAPELQAALQGPVQARAQAAPAAVQVVPTPIEASVPALPVDAPPLAGRSFDFGPSAHSVSSRLFWGGLAGAAVLSALLSILCMKVFAPADPLVPLASPTAVAPAPQVQPLESAAAKTPTPQPAPAIAPGKAAMEVPTITPPPEPAAPTAPPSHHRARKAVKSSPAAEKSAEPAATAKPATEKPATEKPAAPPKPKAPAKGKKGTSDWVDPFAQ